jgi:IPT/TIG domain
MRSSRVAVCSLLSLSLSITGCGGGSQPSTPSSPVTTPTQPVANGVPSITQLTPASVIAGAVSLSVTVAGTGFVNGSAVQWNGAGVTTTYTSDTSLTATVPASDLANGGVAAVTVNNPAPGGGTSASANFTVNNPLPVVNAVNPASVIAGAGAITLDITGSGFVPSSVVNWNGSPLTTTVVSSAELNAALPAADISGSAAEMLTVSNPAPGGGASGTTTFNVTSPAPVVTSISPQLVEAGTAATITVTGTGFETDSVVLWNGSPRPTTFVTSTTLQVALSGTDLQKATVGSLIVSNPGPGGSTSGTASLTVTLQPIPTITAVSISSVPGSGGCSHLQVTITGTNFSSYSMIQVNGKSLPKVTFLGDLSSIGESLPAGFVSKPGGLAFTVTNPFPTSITSVPFAYPATSPTLLAVCALPSPTTVFPASTFTVIALPTEVNSTGNEQVTVGALPAGVTVANATVPMPASGAVLHFQAAASSAPGNDNVTLTASAGTATATGTLALTVSSGAPPAIFLTQAQPKEVGVPLGGSGSTQILSSVNPQNVDFDITPSVTGLPLGTTASFSPAVFSPGQSFTITLTAAANAPVTQNATVTATATPSASASPATTTFFADVTQPPGSLASSRTDFVPIAGTPSAAVYDAVHDLIFASNPHWNRVDVLSNKTHKIVKSIPIIDPRGLDITQDSSRVWVSTDTRRIYSVNTATFAATLYTLPSQIISGDTVDLNNRDRALALADNTIFLYYADESGLEQAGVWDPAANTYTNLNGSGIYPPFGAPTRSGDGTHVYAPTGSVTGNGITVYNTSSRSVTTVSGATPFGVVIAVNEDGSRLVFQNGSQSLGMYDQNLNLIGTVPGSPTSGGGPAFLLRGGAVFSPDGSKIYEIGSYDNQNVVLTIDATSLQVLGVAPAAPTDPVGSSGEAGTATPIAVDPSGIVIGIQNYGISFDDSTFVQNYVNNQPGFNGSSEFIATFAGPLSGGTVSSIYVFPPLTPDVWFGQTRGTASIAGQELSFTSPPSTVPGPVNIKFIYPDGTQMFYPQLFSYSTYPQYTVFSGSAPQGGAPSAVIGYGMPQSSSGGTVSVGGNTGTITTTAGQYPPLSGEPYPSTILNYTFPPGSNGFADLQIQTPIGTGKLSKAIYYAKSVTDYASSDTFTSVLLDGKRNQVYLTAGDHVDVFSTTSNQFLAPIYPAAQSANKQFTGVALTPDGGQLLVTDLQDGSLAVVNPDTPSNTFAIPIAPEVKSTNNCPVGPLYVAATSNQKAFVTTGSLPAISCPGDGLLYIADLTAKTAARPPYESKCELGFRTLPFTDAFSVSASTDGNYVASGASNYSPACIYSVASATYTPVNLPYGFGGSISGDANVLSGLDSLADVNGNRIGDVAQPIALYPATLKAPTTPLYRSPLNASGSLYYVAHSNYFEIIDVLHARLLMRFSLTQTVQNTASPIAIDSGGRHVYLITNQGLTVVDLGEAPLAIGHLSPQTASIGTQVTVRGSGFDASLTATVGGQPATLSVTDENTLTVTVPAASSGPQDIVLTRGDGATYTLENGLSLP